MGDTLDYAEFYRTALELQPLLFTADHAACNMSERDVKSFGIDHNSALVQDKHLYLHHVTCDDVWKSMVLFSAGDQIYMVRRFFCEDELFCSWSRMGSIFREDQDMPAPEAYYAEDGILGRINTLLIFSDRHHKDPEHPWRHPRKLEYTDLLYTVTEYKEDCNACTFGFKEEIKDKNTKRIFYKGSVQGCLTYQGCGSVMQNRNWHMPKPSKNAAPIFAS